MVLKRSTLWASASIGSVILSCQSFTFARQLEVGLEASSSPSTSPVSPSPTLYATEFVGGQGVVLPSDRPSSLIHPSIFPSIKVVSGSHLSLPSDTPSSVPSSSPSGLLARDVSSDTPSLVPSLIPSKILAAHILSDVPSSIPSGKPSNVLATLASDWPSLAPSISPSFASAANLESDAPSSVPSSVSAARASDYPSLSPSIVPSGLLAASETPSLIPSVQPSVVPLVSPAAEHPLTEKSTPPSTGPAKEIFAIDNVILTGVTKVMNGGSIAIFEKATKSFLAQQITSGTGITISKVTVTAQTVKASKRHRQLQQTELVVTFTVAALISPTENTNVDLTKIVTSVFETHAKEFDQALYSASPFFKPLQTTTISPSPPAQSGSNQAVSTKTQSSDQTKFGGKLDIVTGASIGLLISGIFAGWFVRRSRSGSSAKSVDIEKSNSEDSWAATAISPNSLEAANARGFGSSDESETTESSLSSYSSGDSSEEYILKAGSNRYGPNGERSVEEELENLSKNGQLLTPISEIGQTAAALSNCSSISPVSEFSQVKAKVTPRGTKFVQFQVSHDPPEVGEEEPTSGDEQEEVRGRKAGSGSGSNNLDNEAVVQTEVKAKQQPPGKKADPSDEFTLSSFSSLSAALSCGFRYGDALGLVSNYVQETPKQARLEDCEVKTPRGSFIQHNCTPDGTTFVQLNTDSAQDVGEVLSDLTEMEVKWEGNLDSKTTAVSKTPKTNNLQKFKKAPRNVIYQAGARVEL